jgi:rRNA maturation endonuclease Nob1
MVLMNKVKFGQNNLKQKRLKITVPEDLDYQEVFVDVFERFTTDIKLTNVKTTAMGSLYQLSYDIVLKEEDNVKAFIDDLRIRNGNLNISLNLIDDVTYG